MSNKLRQRPTQTSTAPSVVEETTVLEQTFSEQPPVTETQPVLESKPAEVPVTPVVPKPAKPKESPLVYKIELELSHYVEGMNPATPVSEEQGGQWQHSLYSLIRSMLDAQDQATFNREWNTFLTVVFANKDGVFSEYYAFRFPEQWQGSGREYAVFRRLLYLAIFTADPKTRKANFQASDLERLSDGLTEAQRNRLFAFY